MIWGCCFFLCDFSRCLRTTGPLHFLTVCYFVYELKLISGGGSLTAVPCKEESKELRVRKDRSERLRTDISGIPRVTRPSQMGFSFTLPPWTNYSLSCRSGYFRLLAETQHNGLIHRVTCRVFGDALCWIHFLVGCDGEKQSLTFSRGSKLPRWKPAAAPQAALRAPWQEVMLRMTGSSCPRSPQRRSTCTRPQMSTRWRTKANSNQSWSQLGTASNMVCWLFSIFSMLIKPNLNFYLFWHMKLVCPLFMFQAGPSNQSPNLARALQWLCSESPMSSGNQVRHLDSL